MRFFFIHPKTSFQPFFGGKLLAVGLSAFVSGRTRLVYGAADIILVPTARVKQSLKSLYRRKRIVVIARGVEPEKYRPLITAGSKLTALYVARVSVEKNLEKLAFFQQHRAIQLKIVGDGKNSVKQKEFYPKDLICKNCSNHIRIEDSMIENGRVTCDGCGKQIEIKGSEVNW